MMFCCRKRQAGWLFAVYERSILLILSGWCEKCFGLVPRKEKLYTRSGDSHTHISRENHDTSCTTEHTFVFALRRVVEILSWHHSESAIDSDRLLSLISLIWIHDSTHLFDRLAVCVCVSLTELLSLILFLFSLFLSLLLFQYPIVLDILHDDGHQKHEI